MMEQLQTLELKQVTVNTMNKYKIISINTELCEARIEVIFEDRSKYVKRMMVPILTEDEVIYAKDPEGKYLLDEKGNKIELSRISPSEKITQHIENWLHDFTEARENESKPHESIKKLQGISVEVK